MKETSTTGDEAAIASSDAGIEEAVARSAPWDGALGRPMVLAAACLCVFVLALVPRERAVNTALALGTDEAQYVGAARDFMRTGSFAEQIHNRLLPHFLPLGYPALVVVAYKVSGIEPLVKSAIGVSLFFGALVPALVLGLTWRVSRSPWAAGIATSLAIVNWPLIRHSSTAMTDTSYMCGLLLVAWALFEFFDRQRVRGFFALCLVLGLLFAGLFLVRISALYLLVAVPLLLLVANRLRPTVSRSRLAAGIALFLAIGAAVVGASSWRLYQLNGYFSISPQISGNATIGQFIEEGDASVFKLDSTATTTRRRHMQRSGTSLPDLWRQDPSGQLAFLARNAAGNLWSLWESAWNRSRPLALFVVLALAAVFWLGRRMGGRGPTPIAAGTRGERSRRLATGGVVLGGIGLLHLAAYSLFMVWPRYMEQVLPLLLIGLGIGIVALVAPFRRWWIEVVHLDGRGVERRRSLNGTTLAIPALCVLFLVPQGMGSAVWIHRMRHPGSDQYRASREPMEQGLAMRRIAEARGEDEVRVVNTQWSVAFYAQGFGYPVPFTEESPNLLGRYLRRHEIQFVAIDSRVAFGQTQTAIPLWHLLSLLSRSQRQDGSVRSRDGFFELHPSALPDFRPVGTWRSGAGPPELAPDRAHLLLARLGPAGSFRRGETRPAPVLSEGRWRTEGRGSRVFTLLGAEGYERLQYVLVPPADRSEPLADWSLTVGGETPETAAVFELMEGAAASGPASRPESS